MDPISMYIGGLIGVGVTGLVFAAVFQVTSWLDARRDRKTREATE